MRPPSGQGCAREGWERAAAELVLLVLLVLVLVLVLLVLLLLLLVLLVLLVLHRAASADGRAVLLPACCRAAGKWRARGSC